MLSVIIETENDEEGLARTLASLVGGSVVGIVRKVVICDSGSGDGTRAVADHAGCVFASAGISAGLAEITDEWVLLLQPGAQLAEGWTTSVAEHCAKVKSAARFARARGSRLPFLSRVFRRPDALAQGLLVTTRQAIVLARRAGSGEAIARGLAVKTLRAEIWPAPPK
jgi:glycosyltransferase involved in cell wall biosynthesis